MDNFCTNIFLKPSICFLCEKQLDVTEEQRFPAAWLVSSLLGCSGGPEGLLKCFMHPWAKRWAGQLHFLSVRSCWPETHPRPTSWELWGAAPFPKPGNLTTPPSFFSPILTDICFLAQKLQKTKDLQNCDVIQRNQYCQILKRRSSSRFTWCRPETLLYYPGRLKMSLRVPLCPSVALGHLAVGLAGEQQGVNGPAQAISKQGNRTP